MPVRSGGALLSLALQSVFKSRGVTFELVAVAHAADASVDAVLEQWARAHSSVVVLSASGDVGLGGALELGRTRCRAPFIARMDADDLMHPRRLEADVQALRHEPELSAVGCRVRQFPRDLPGVGMRAYVRWQNSLLSSEELAREIWIEQTLCHPATTFRASALRDVGGYRDGPFPEDYDLFLRLVVAGHVLRKRPEVHHGWREHGNRATRWDSRYARDAFATLKATALKERFGLGERSVIVGGAGKEGGRIGRALLAAQVQPAAFLDVSPARVGRMRHGAQVHAAEALEELWASMEAPFFIGAVGTSGARGVLRAKIAAAGLTEGSDAVFVC